MFTSLLINATRRRRGHIPRLLLRYSRVIFNIRTQKRILQLLSEDEFSRIPRLQPVFPFKYLHENYLATGLSIEQKAQALLTHYRFLKSYFNRESLGKLLYEPLTVFSKNTDSNAYIDIVLLASHISRIEGELSLLLKLNEINTFILSFTIVPGQIVCCAEERVLLVPRVQGERCVRHEVRTVTKALRGVSPPMALLDALQGIASALCINHLAAVPAVQQSYFSEEHAQTFLKSYDEFFFASGLTRGAGGFFEAPFPLPKKPLGAIKSGNRPRAKAQREIRTEIAETVRQVMMQHRRA
jgi:uncharacterized protein VirK/YbjX